jgi:hypothetical protein
MKRRIAILFHEKQRGQAMRYLVDYYAEFWREDGHEVFYLFGVAQFVPADLVIVHVDLSVVPDEYLEFAKRYPVALNGEVKDIRKATYSRLLVKPGDAYEGKVIVKSNFNFAAGPERSLGVPLDPRGVSSSFFGSPLDYQIFEHPRAVPHILFDDPNVVVEKFQPEMEDDLYILRSMLFIGDHFSCTRMASRQPIVNGSTRIRADRVEAHPDIVKLGKAMKFDYGKFDYVIHDGQSLLLDANKTTGGATIPSSAPEMLAARRYRAEGLYDYFARTRQPGD